MTTTNSPKLHLNENLSPRLAIELRRYGFDVPTSHEQNMLGLPDSKQLAYAVLEQRAILTFNVYDFARLHDKYLAAGKQHWSIIFSTTEPIGVLVHRLLRLLNSISANEMKNQIRWLNEFK